MLPKPPALNDPSLLIGKNFVNGQWLDSSSGKTFEVRDPATDALIGTCPESTTTDLSHAINSASSSLPKWKSLSGRERSRILRKWYDLVLENKRDIATLITWENGKSSADAEGEVLFAASFIEWYAEEAARIYGDVVPHSSATTRVTVVKEPIGVCGLITPWNYPAGMITRKVAPALAAGCTAVIKSDGVTPFTANALALLAQRAGIPNGVINIVTALENTPELGLAICKSPIIKKVSFTGSTRVGKLLAEQSASTLKKLSLELGGNAPFVVFEDSDIDFAVAGLIASKFKVTGQTCVSANRVYVQEGIYEKFTDALADVVRKFKVGSGFDRSTTHGPLVGANAVTKTEAHVQDAVSKGAKVAAGGKKLPELGKNFFEPTVLTGVNDSMKIAHEETFGPVAALFKFSTEEEVVKLANNSDVGLASYVFTNDLSRAARMSENMEAGMVAINTGGVSDAGSPFGGIKHSGLGREGGKYGLEEYLELKTVITGNIQPSRARL